MLCIPGEVGAPKMASPWLEAGLPPRNFLNPCFLFTKAEAAEPADELVVGWLGGPSEQDGPGDVAEGASVVEGPIVVDCPSVVEGTSESDCPIIVVGPNRVLGVDGPGGPSIGDGPGDPSIGDGPGGPSMGDGPGGPSIGDGPGGPSIVDGLGAPSIGDDPGGPSIGDGPGGPVVEVEVEVEVAGVGVTGVLFGSCTAIGLVPVGVEPGDVV